MTDSRCSYVVRYRDPTAQGASWHLSVFRFSTEGQAQAFLDAHRAGFLDGEVVRDPRPPFQMLPLSAPVSDPGTLEDAYRQNVRHWLKAVLRGWRPPA